GAAHALVKSRDLVIELVTALVEASTRTARHLLGLRADDAGGSGCGGQSGCKLEHAQRPARIPIGGACDELQSVGVDAETGSPEPVLAVGECTLEQLAELLD